MKVDHLIPVSFQYTKLCGWEANIHHSLYYKHQCHSASCYAHTHTAELEVGGNESRAQNESGVSC